MRWRRWAVALIPAAAGLMVATLFYQIPEVPNPIVSIRVDVGTAALIVGCAGSMVALAYVTVWSRTARGHRRQVADIRAAASEERRRFLQRLDHELKNPLTAIRIGLANLSGTPPPPERQKALASVRAEVLRLSRLTSDLRKLADLETRPLEQDQVDAAELLVDVIKVAEDQPEVNGRRLTLTLPQAPWPVPTILGDRDLLFLVFYNLLDNALKFTQPGDTVEVRAFDNGNVVAVEVADTGPGIPGGEIPRIWEELYRGQEARGVPGSGLGLALVRAIVERHDGRVSVRSRVGQGTVVRIILPVA